MNQTGEFLRAIWRPVGYGEIRVIQPRAKIVQQHFIPLAEEGIDAATALVYDQTQMGGADIFLVSYRTSQHTTGKYLSTKTNQCSTSPS